MMIKKFYIFIGNYGSGKTELSLNFALDFARSNNTVLVDLDIVNPYFRSSEKRELLAQSGVDLIAPVFANKTIDSPSLPPDVASVFVSGHERVVFDVGGDPVGATALGRYHADFAPFKDCVEVLYVINARRPLSSNADDILEMLTQIRDRARLKITGLINNTNLGSETTPDDLVFGHPIVREVSDRALIPIRFVTGYDHVLSGFLPTAGGNAGEALPIVTRMRPFWQELE